MDAKKLIQQAKIGLVLNEPFFASLALRMDYVETDSIPTAGCDGSRIKYNPKFIQTLQTQQCMGLIAHEVMHVAMMHHLRMQGKEARLWNVACDYAINPLLKKSHLYIPEGGLDESRFHDLSAEEIYGILQKEQQDEKEGQQNEEQGDSGEEAPENFGQVEAPPQGTDLKEVEQQTKQAVIQAYNDAKQMGNTPNGMKEIITELIEPKKNWKELLQKYVAEVARNDYSWVRPNPRYIPSGLYLPALHSLNIGKVVFVIDTSGSIDTELLHTFVAELKEASSIFTSPITVIHCDTEVRKVEEMEQDDIITPIGRGGTQFQPAFDYVNENIIDAKAIVYFTDGGSWDGYKEPNCEVIWAIYDNKDFKPAFGDIILVDK